MGKQSPPDICGPLSPKAKLQAERKQAVCHTGKKLRLCCLLLFGISLALCFVFLGLFVWHYRSDPVRQLKDCRVELRNQTSQMRDNLGSMEKRVAETRSDLDKAKVEGERLQARLAAANWSLEKAREEWGTCQEQLRSVEKNATSQVKEAVQREMEKNKVAEEEIKQLKQQVSNLLQMKELQQKEIQQLQDDLTKDKPLVRSKGDLLGPSVVLFPLLLVGFLL